MNKLPFKYRVMHQCAEELQKIRIERLKNATSSVAIHRSIQDLNKSIKQSRNHERDNN